MVVVLTGVCPKRLGVEILSTGQCVAETGEPHTVDITERRRSKLLTCCLRSTVGIFSGREPRDLWANIKFDMF